MCYKHKSDVESKLCQESTGTNACNITGWVDIRCTASHLAYKTEMVEW